MPLRVINAALVHQLLPMAQAVNVMADAMLAVSSGTVANPARLMTALIDNSGLLGVMPGSSAELKTYGAKVIGLHPDNPARGLPAIQGFVSLFDHDSGDLLAIVEGAAITALRTAAASGLATRELAKADASSCGIFGTGVQAISHIDAMCAVRSVVRVRIYGRDYAKAQHLAQQQAARTGLDVQATQTPEETAACDLICTVTGSPVPILQGSWVQPGAHINLVGAHSLSTREAATDLVVKSAVYVDLLASAKNEGGDVMIPVREGALQESHIRGEIGQVLAAEITGREDDSQITLYKSLGITAQDLFAARYVYDRAVELELGDSIDF